MTIREIECPQCHTTFIIEGAGNKRFCSQKCRQDYNNNLVHLERERVKRERKYYCRYCGKEFTPTMYNQKYCGEECKKQGQRASLERCREKKIQTKRRRKKKLNAIDEVLARADHKISYGKLVEQDTIAMQESVAERAKRWREAQKA